MATFLPRSVFFLSRKLIVLMNFNELIQSARTVLGKPERKNFFGAKKVEILDYMTFFILIPPGMFFLDYMATGLYGQKKPILGQFCKSMDYMAGHIIQY